MKTISLLFLFLFIVSCNITSPKNNDSSTIVIMFDDGRISIFNNALPILSKYGILATNAIVTKNIGNDYTLSWNQVALLDTLYGWETASHTYSHPHLNELDYDDFVFQMQKSYNDIVSHNLQVNTLAIPYGTMRDDQYQIAARYYKNIRNSIDLHIKSPVNRKFLGCFTVHKDTQLSEIYDRIYYAYQNNEIILILLFHGIDNSGNEYSYSIENFEKVIKFIKKNNFKTATLNQALENIKNE